MLTGHTDWVRALAAVPRPDGSPLLASASDDQTVRLWDLATGAEVRRLTGQTGAVRALAVLPGPDGGVLLASAGADRVVRLWDPVTGAEVRQLTGHTGWMFALAAVPGRDGATLLASASNDRTVRLWDPATGGAVRQLQTGAVWALAVVPGSDGSAILACASNDGMLRLWDPATGTELRRLTGRTGRIRALAAVPLPAGGSLLATAGADRVIRLWDPVTGALRRQLDGHAGEVWALAAVPTPDGGALLASAGADQRVRLWDPASSDQVSRLTIADGAAFALAAVPGPAGRGLVTLAGEDTTIRLWDPIPGADDEEPTDDDGPAESTEADEHPTAAEPAGTLTDYTETVLALAAVPGPDGNTLLATAGVDGTVLRWDTATGARVGPPLVGHTGEVRTLAVLPDPDGDGVLLASAGRDRTVVLWTATGHPGRRLTGHYGTVRALAAVPGPDGATLLASAGDDGMLRLWDPATGTEVRHLGPHLGPVTALAVVAGQHGATLLAAAGLDAVRLWDPATGTEVRQLTSRVVTIGGSAPGGVGVRREVSPVQALAAVPAPNGNSLLAAVDVDGTVQLWDPVTGAPAAQLAGHTRAVRAIAAVPGPDGATLLASAGADRTVRLWDPATGTQLRQLTGHPDPVVALAAVPGPDGAILLASAGGKTVRLWDVTPGRRVKFRGFADRPAVVDLLDRADLVAVLATVLGAGAADADRDAGPTVISVEGRWGAGKTSVLTLLRDELARSAAEGGQRAAGRPVRQPRVTVGRATRALASGRPPRLRQPTSPAGQVVAWFNPWAHQSADQVWAGLAKAVLEAAGPAIHGEQGGEAYWFCRNLRRLDRRELHRQLWRRVRSPLLAASALALVVPLATQLAIRDSTVTVQGHRVASGLLALALPAALLTAGLLHTAGRYLFARASSFLPGSLFRGPVLSGALAQADTAREADIRDPLYHSRSGYLYLVQHDVKAVLTDLKDARGELVVFIDDLDRCTPATTAQVLEAINLFLSDSFPRARFVLGLDPEVVSAHVDRMYADLVRTPTAAFPGDPTSGWTFLRKLVQLPVALPAIAEETIDRLLDATLRPVVRPPAGAPAPPADPPTRAGGPSGPAATPAAASRPTDPADDRPASTAGVQSDEPATGAAAPAVTGGPTAGPAPTSAPASPVDPADPADDERIAAALERHPDVRERLRDRLAHQPERSAREAKRLLTIWQFYVRLLQRAQPTTGAEAIGRARHLVIVAEIIARWPAQQAVFRQPVDGKPDQRGLHALTEAADDDLGWATTVARLALPSAAGIADDLRRLLRQYDGDAVADLYAQVT
jgi:WD40 repeat protein